MTEICELVGMSQSAISHQLRLLKQADLVIWKTDNLDYLFYRFGQNLAKTVIKNGKVC